MKDIIIPWRLLSVYLDEMTFEFSQVHQREFEIGDEIPLENYREGEIMLKRTQEPRILELGLLYLIDHPEISTSEVPHTEMEWSDTSVRLIITEVLAHWFPVHDPKLVAMLSRVELKNMGLAEWRISIRDKILMEMRAVGIMT
jgi:hypothetical protein